MATCGYFFRATDRLPVEFDRVCLAAGVDEAEGVYAEAFHGPIGVREAAVAHVPHDVMSGLGMQRGEIPEGVVSGLGLRDLPVGVRLGRMDDVRELDAILD